MTFGVKFNTGTGADNILISNEDTPPGLFHSLHSIVGYQSISTETINLTNVTKPLYVATFWENFSAVWLAPSVTISYNFPNKTAVATVSFTGTFFAAGNTCWFYFLEA